MTRFGRLMRLGVNADLMDKWAGVENYYRMLKANLRALKEPYPDW